MGLLLDVIDLLAKDGCLPPQYKPHQLKGRFVGIWECHIQPDWLLLWQQHDDEFTLLVPILIFFKGSRAEFSVPADVKNYW